MKKSIGIAIAASAMMVSLNASQTVNLSQGWNLVGTYVSEGDLSSNSDLSIIWKYTSGKWSAYSAESTIKAVLDKHQEIGKFGGVVKSGEGFWALAKNATTLNFNGNPANSKLNISKGWNLLSLTSDKSLSVDYFQNVATIWKWDRANEKWQVYSPNSDLQSKIASKVADGTIETFNVIKPGEGFWVYGGSASEVDLSNPPSIGFAYELVSKLNAVPLTNAKVYANGNQVGTTDNSGKFMISGLSDGTAVTIKKDGYAVAYGVVKDGKVVVITQKNNNQKVAFSQGENFSKVAKKGITSQDGKVALIVNSMDLTKDVTVSVIPFMSPSAAPTLNDLVINSKSIPVNQLALIGGAYINVEDTSGNLLSNGDNIGTVSFDISQSTILVDLENILNGGAETSTYETFSANAFSQFNDMIANNMMEIVVAQFIDGKWVYKGTGKLASYDKKQKKPDGTITTYTKYKLQTNTSLNKLAPTAFLLKMNFLTGEATICSHEEGYKMFDGSIVDKKDSNSPVFDWVGDPIPLVTIIGDDSVESGAGLTGDDGCIKVTYKVPFMKPTFNLTLKKDGYYDTEVSCSVDSDGAKCSDADLYKIPDTASIEGHVTDKVTSEGIANALVTLENPEVLSADKVQSGDENGTAYVKVGYMPNVTYTWSAVKYDDNNNSKVVVDPIVIKTGKGNASYATLNEKEIYDVLVKPFDGSNATFDAKYLTGNWELRVKAVHTFTNTSNTMTEEAIGKFDIDLLMKKLAGLMSGQLSEAKKEVVVDENGTETTLPAGISSAAVYGGFSIGFLYEYGAQNDAFEWQTSILADATNIADYDGIYNDYNETDVNESSWTYDAIANKVDLKYINVAKGNVLKYKKSLYPVGFNVKFLAKHFAELLNKDPEDNTKPFITSGFTVRTLFKGTISIPSTDENYNTTENNITQYLASYSDISGANSVSDVLDTAEISLVGSSATAYMRQVLTDSEDAGYYRINMIPPALSGGLEVFAKADGYKFDANSDIKLVNDLEKGKVSTYDLELEPVSSNIVEKNETTGEVNVPPIPVDTSSFSDWNLTGCNDYSKWQVVANPLTIAVDDNATGWMDTVWGDTNVTLLPDADVNTTGYIWFGNINTGMFSDKQNFSSSAVCGKAITKEVNLSNYSFPVLNFKSWFEVESVDVAKGMYDQMKVGFIIPSSSNGGATTVSIYTANGDKETVYTDTYYPLDSLNPEYEPDIQDANVPYSSAGINALPVWKNYSVAVDGLAGYNVKFVFDFNSMDSLFNGFRGWGIDDVKVENSMNNVLALPPMVPETNTAITSPKVLR